MTGKLTYRVDDNETLLYSWPGGPGTPSKRSGKLSADLEITIDLDKLRTLLVREALRTKSCRLTRACGAIVVKPIKGSVKVTGSGRS